MTQYFKLEFYQWPRKNCKTKAGCQKQCFRLLLYPRQHHKDLGRPTHPAAPMEPAEWNGALFYRDSVARTQCWLLLPQRWLLHPLETFHSVLPLPECLEVDHGSLRVGSQFKRGTAESTQPPASGRRPSSWQRASS